MYMERTYVGCPTDQPPISAERKTDASMGEHIFETVKDKELPLAEQVAGQIRQLIIDRQLTNGEKLPNEFELAQQLNVGRGTVREAVKLLVARNVLEIRRGRGTFGPAYRCGQRSPGLCLHAGPAAPGP